MDCIFCTDPAVAGDILFEDEHTWIVLHHDWSPRGHAMIAAKRHVENASDLGEEEWRHFTRAWRRAEGVLLEATQMQRAMILKLGIQTPHLHVHIYPAPATATRDDVFAAFDGERGAERDSAWVAAVRGAMKSAMAT
jgi:diadenosine tetraphosphate (Ap4A) HIT family hydrolase